MGNCTEKSAMIQKYFKGNKSNKMVDCTKPPPLMPMESGLEDSMSNISVNSIPRQSRHKVTDYFKNRRADSLPRHINHIRTFFKQNSEEKTEIPVSKSSPNNFRLNNVSGDRPLSQEVRSALPESGGRVVVGRIRSSRNPSVRISASDVTLTLETASSPITAAAVTTNETSAADNIDPRCLVAMFDYHARTTEELELRKGDKLLLVNELDPDWWLMELRESKVKGYIPSSFVAVESSLESQDWFISRINRKDSERLLLLQCNTQGTFLVRQSETSEGALSLSVRDIEPGGWGSVKHYKIRGDTGEPGSTGGGGWCCITSRHRFPGGVAQLVEHYRRAKDGGGLCCQLTRPCPRPAPVTADLCLQTKAAWNIPRSQLELVERLGAGQFGEVWRARWNGTTWVAVKTLLEGGSMSATDFLKEAATMRALAHPRLVRLYAVCTDQRELCLVTELMGQGSLLAYLREGPGSSLEIRALVDFMAQIASGMRYIEAQGYIHRDLAARNILVGDGGDCKIADFGLARMTGAGGGTYEAREGSKFPIKWTAPEAALLGRFSIKSDVWSYGVVLHEIVTRGKVPYPSMNNTETLAEVERGYRMPCPVGCPNKIYQVMLHCWHKNSDERPTFEFLCEIFENFYVHSEASYKHAAAAAAAAIAIAAGATTTTTSRACGGVLGTPLLIGPGSANQEPELTAV